MFLVYCLYCALLAVSMFNTMLLVWLSLIVLLNAERRGWGVWLTGCGLAAGGAVFLSHSAVLIESVTAVGSELNAWWPLGWSALIFSPFAWYVAMLWHAGYWEDRKSKLRRRHRLPSWVSLALVTLLFVLFLLAKPLPFTIQTNELDLSAAPAVFGIPLLVLLYPLFILFCISLSLDALVRPAPSERAMRGPARRRARPWLIAASLALLVVSFLLMVILLWLVFYSGRNILQIVIDRLAIRFMWLDLAISLLVGVAVVLVGQAVVVYEIFTGKTLPRRGLRRQWHNVIIVAAGSGLAVSLSFGLQLPPIYVFLLATMLLAVAYALLSWRAYVERERYISHLRPFVASEHAYDALLASSPDSTPDIGALAPFVALCRDILGVRSAYLVPAGTLSSLIAGPLTYPPGTAAALDIHDVLTDSTSPAVMSIPLDPERCAGAIWAVPLWSARGLIGLLLLGPKSDGGLYSEEEMEIARSSGERLLDTIATANLAQRLMALQRQRFIETQVLDQQSRRALHDEILPTLHAAMLSLSNQPAQGETSAGAMAQLAEVHRRLSVLLREMPVGRASQVAELGLLGALRDMMETEFTNDFDEVTWHIEPQAEQHARTLSTLASDVVFYAAKEVIRNSARHGRGRDPARPLQLRIDATWHNGLEVRIADDGVGMASTAQSWATSGHGLALHGTMLAVIGGSLVTEHRSGAGTSVTLFLPQERWQEA